MLTNSTVPARAPGAFTAKIAAAALGKPVVAPKEVKIDPKSSTSMRATTSCSRGS